MTAFSLRAVLLVALGGALGSVARYLAGLWLLPATSGGLAGIPLATLLVNVAGSLLIGLLIGWFPTGASPEGSLPWLRLLLATGFCGGFTTFSAFSAETLTLLTGGRVARAATYGLLTVGLGLTATWLGWRLGSAVGGRLPAVPPLP